MNEIIEKLDRLADMRSQKDLIDLHFDNLRDEILTPELKAKLDNVEAERQTSLEALQGGMSSLEAEIKTAVLDHGATVNGKYLQCVWSKGRVSWNNNALDGYAAAHPEIAKFRKEGKPSASIKDVK